MSNLTLLDQVLLGKYNFDDFVGEISKIVILEMCYVLLGIIIAVWIINCNYESSLVVKVVAIIEEFGV
jgi:uncharacterized membrane protein